MSKQWYRARFVLTPDGVRADTAVCVEGGRFVAVGAPGQDAVDLGDVALVPGLVNAHSHAFQRIIRGRTEWLDPARPHEDFWSWRTQMYAAANALSAEQIYAVSRMAFLEMALAGITAVGEFHYLFHRPDGRRYEDPNQLPSAVIEAARAVGLRVALLRVAYHRGGFEEPLGADQRRFRADSVEGFVADTDALVARWRDDVRVTVGVAPHSVRAVPRRWLEALAEVERPIHVHVCEQRAEIEQCVAEHGVGPIELLDQAGLLRPNTTLVHATHLQPGDVEAIARSGATVCACPTTERNLGDGFLPARDLFEAGVPVCLGSDSQAEIDLFGEARLVEYHERLRVERRNVLAKHAASYDTAEALWPAVAEHGARSLGLSTGRITLGAPADFTTVDLAHPTLLGVDADSLVSHLVFAGTAAHVRDVFVGGDRVVEAGQHPDQAEICAAYAAVRRALT